MGQDWFIEINIEPKKGKFNQVENILRNMDIPKETFKEPEELYDKNSNEIRLSGGLYAPYSYGSTLRDELIRNLKGLIKKGNMSAWHGDFPQGEANIVRKEKLKKVI